ncbi:ribonuclease HII [Geomicrobium sp. JCM 19038]|uniref:ribonuclease HII n=1 Tax=Geomicrobium sp. JCM 19038 TaxID=1460635 RepID=UPI00045F27E2|nr:ribonuclease HII [Geomicrobium sp. JCM 19038]GAK07503.1 ribonuclease HII [Geomicrobium sp. JCM 19038]
MKKATIKDIKSELTGETIEATRLEELRADSRTGVQNLLKSYEQKQQLLREKMQSYTDKRNEEFQMCNTWQIAGLDEVGRGPLAGPVTTAAVMIPEDVFLPGLTDSKKLSKRDRAYFYDEIMSRCTVSIGEASVEEIDEFNIYEATKLAMVRAVTGLKTTPDHLLVDAMTLPVTIRQTSLIKGDSRSMSIAAASVIAKETRDEYMKTLHEQYPQYGFDQHVGYGTSAHLQAMDEYGVLPVHRRSFRPVADRIY